MDEVESDFFKGLEEKPKFVTSDFYLSAFLLAKGFTLNATKWVDAKRLAFEFHDKGDVNQLVDDFMLGKTEINTKQFINAIRSIKDIINQAKFSRTRTQSSPYGP